MNSLPGRVIWSPDSNSQTQCLMGQGRAKMHDGSEVHIPRVCLRLNAASNVSSIAKAKFNRNVVPPSYLETPNTKKNVIRSL